MKKFNLVKDASNLFDRIFDRAHVRFIERRIIFVAFLGLLIHVGLIAVARFVEPTPRLLMYLDINFLSALYTPFSFILFYEVLLLILSIPESTTAALGRQYEIISLIVIRNVFKDIAQFESFEVVSSEIGNFLNVLLDMSGGLLMFLLVGVFYHLRNKAIQLTERYSENERITPQTQIFIERKKAVALSLAFLLFGLAASNLIHWFSDAYHLVYEGIQSDLDIETIFYKDVFAVMIFTDVAILLLSMLQGEDYKLVIRNAGFIISTILIRFSLTIERPYGVPLGIVAMIFGILILSVYYYFLKISKEPQENQEL